MHGPGREPDLSFQVCIGFIAFSIWNKGTSVFLMFFIDLILFV